MTIDDSDDELEAWIDEATSRCKAADCHGPVFEHMRATYGTKKAMERLVVSGEIQSGFVRLRQHGLLDWSIEAGVLKFPRLFSREAQECAQFRLSHADDRALRTR